MQNEELAITEKDMQEARESFQKLLSEFREIGNIGKASQSNKEPNEIEDNDDYMIIKLRGGREFRGQNSIKMKTIFHSVEVKFEDRDAGVFTCNYNIRNALSRLNEWILDKYPPTTSRDIQRIADARQISFDVAKKQIALAYAEAEFWMRIEMAKFLHEQLEPALKIVIGDLVEDAALYGLSRYGCKLANAKDFDKTTKGYTGLRKKRTHIITDVGKRGKAPISLQEFTSFVEMIFTKMGELESAGKKITPNAVARKIIGDKHSNPLKAFKDKLRRYEVTFEELKEDYTHVKSEQENS